MPLTLRIISPQKDLLGADSTKVFSVHGGTIGRAPDNDWVLPDPDRYVSAHHAIIDYQGGGYFLTDTSSNGVYVNDSDQSVGSGAPLRLHDGDRLRLGRYRVTVSIVNVGRDATADTGIFLADDEPDPAPKAGDQAATPTTENARGSEPLGLNLQLVADAPAPSESSDDEDAEPLTIIEPVDAVIATRPAARDPLPHEGDATAETQPVAALQRAALRESLELLLRATGADPRLAPAGDEEKLLRRLGEVLLAAVGGLARTLGVTDRPAPPSVDGDRAHNPLLGPGDLGQAINDLLFDDLLQEARPTDAIDEAFAELLAHQAALARAGRAAWLDLLDRMAPATLEAGFDKTGSRGSLLRRSGKSRYWDQYREFYEDLARRADERFGEVFEDTYRRIYQAERDRRAFREEREENPAPPLPVAD